MSDEKSTALVVQPRSEERAIQAVKMLSNIILALRTDVLKKDVDFGVIPGTGDKPTLLLPGMEKLMRALNAVPEYIERCVIRDYATPLFHYEYECRLIDADTGMPIPGGRGLGLCTSMESSFAWRWVDERFVPPGLDKSTLQKRGGKITEFAFAIDKAETGGKYGKPAEYWQSFKTAIESGTAKSLKKATQKGTEMDAWEIDSTVYRILNPDIFDQLNAIIKRAKKRSLGDAVKGAANVSEHFTVDVEDFVRYDDAFDVPFTVTIEPPKKQDEPPPQESEGKQSDPTPPASDPPLQPEPDAPPSWAAIEKNFKLFKASCIKITGDWDAIVPGLVRDKAITDINDPSQWGKAFLTGRDAALFVEQAFSQAMSNEPPAQPKSKATKATHTWTDEEIEAMDTATGRFWDPVMLQHLDPTEALRLMEKKAWTEFGDPKLAIAALRTMCIQKVMPIVATAATYLKAKHSEITNGILDVQKYGLREELAKLGDDWATYVETWEKGQAYTFSEDEMPHLIVNWNLDKGVPVMTKVGILELTF